MWLSEKLRFQYIVGVFSGTLQVTALSGPPKRSLTLSFSFFLSLHRTVTSLVAICSTQTSGGQIWRGQYLMTSSHHCTCPRRSTSQSPTPPSKKQPTNQPTTSDSLSLPSSLPPSLVYLSSVCVCVCVCVYNYGFDAGCALIIVTMS